MRNIQVIDSADNCVYDIFAATDEEFALIFPEGTDIAFIDEICEKDNQRLLDDAFDRIWERPVKKSEAQGIHGIIFYGFEEKKIYYPTRKDADAINPDGTRLRCKYVQDALRM